MVYEKIAEKLDTLKNVRATEKKNINPEINELRNKIKAIELSQSKIADMLLSPDANADLLEIMNQKASKLKSEKTSLLIRIDELENNKIDAKKVVDLSKKWKTASFEEKRGVCQILINRIIIDKNGNAEIVWNI